MPPANAALPPHLHLQTSYTPSAHFISFPSALSPPYLAPGCLSTTPAFSPPDSLRVLQWNSGGLRARSTELLHFLLSHPADFIYIQESNSNSSSFFRIPGFSALRSDRTNFRSGILSRDATHASGGVIIFVRQGLFFSELFTSPLSLPDPRYSDYVGINIFPNNSSSLSFLNVYALLFAFFQQITVSTPFLLPFFPPPEIFSFWRTSTAITPSGIQEVLPTHEGRKYSTASSLLSFSLSMTLTHPPFSIAPLAVAPPMKSPMLLLLLSFLALG